MEVIDRSQPLNLIEMELDRKTLHDHQKKATDSLDNYFNIDGFRRKSKNGMLVMPTGSGKTFTAVNWLLDRAVSKGYKVVWLVHRQELVDQADFTFRKQAPIMKKYDKKKLRVLPVSGGHYSMSLASRYDIYVCCIGSVASKNGMRYIRRMLGTNGREKLVVVIDEAHHAVSPSYQKVIKKITELNPNRLLLGLTATPTRMQENEKIRLLKMFDSHKNGFIYDVKLKELIANGFLAQPVYKRVETQINGEVEFEITDEDEKYFSMFGELSEKIKEQIALSASRNNAIVKEYLDNKNKYGKTLVFAINRLHAVTLAKSFRDAGILCDYCISGEPDTQAIIQDFKNNEFEVLINVQILTEGSDVPDINTIFLTRPTNSDSLLMQMIGRGLRGEDAGGTKLVYLVDFHDTWERFTFWLDPRDLLKQEFEVDDITPTVIEVGPENDTEGEEIPGNETEFTDYDYWDLCRKIYTRMRVNVIGLSQEEVFPHGWYSVVDEEGQDTKVLVFDNQLEGYKSINDDVENILANEIEALKLIKDYFDCETNLPKVNEMEFILEYINEMKEMPQYFTFKEREQVDAKEIAKDIIEKDLRRSEEEKYLEEKYNNNPIIKDLYKTKDIFVSLVSQAIHKILHPPKENHIITIDEREEFNIVEGFYDINKLLAEVIKEVKQHEWFTVENIPQIRWSRKPLRSRYGLCTRHEDGSFSISINKLLCSPNVEVEVIKYVIYHELIHACVYWNHEEKFREQEWKYPNSDELDGALDELFFKYDLERIVPERKRRV